MGGLRPDPVPARRLADIARAGGARGAGAYLPAVGRGSGEARTQHTPGRVLTPPSTASGLIVSHFDIPGTLTAGTTHPRKIPNPTGAVRTITRIVAYLDFEPSGSAVELVLGFEGGSTETATVVIPPGSNLGEVSTNIAWGVSGGSRVLSVTVTAVGSVNPGADLTVQVLSV